MVFCLYIPSSFALHKGVREVTGWRQDENSCDNGNIDFDPFMDNIDITWELTNPVCISYMAGVGATLVGTGYGVDYACKAANYLGAPKAKSESAGGFQHNPYLSQSITGKMVRGSSLCASRIGEKAAIAASLAACSADPLRQCMVSMGAYWTTQASLAKSDASRCCWAYGAYATAVSAATTALYAIYDVAKNAYKKARICGHDWNNWRKFDVNGNQIPSAADGIWRHGPYEGSYQHCIESIFVRHQNPCGLENIDGVPYNSLSLKNKYYREYLYGGKEFSDGSCSNPGDANERLASLGYSDDAQRYYMKGPGLASNYACHRFKVNGSSFNKESSEIYDCCVQRSQSSLCIESTRLHDLSYDYKFCDAGSRCELKEVTFETFWATSDSEFLCAKTYSVCPYNHLLGGGSEEYEYETDALGNPTPRKKNFCQVMRHCAKIPALPYIRISALDGAFISSACKDLRGDTQNVYSFNAELLPGGTDRGFSAPLIQCFKETVQNMVSNKAGDTKCRNPDESPSKDGTCTSGYLFEKGSYLNSKSPFVIIQESFHWIIKMVLTLSISLFGGMVLLGMKPIEKKKLASYLIKISIVMYFALGTGWHDVFLDGIFDISTTLGDVMMKLDDEQTIKLETVGVDKDTGNKIYKVDQNGDLVFQVQDKPEELKDGCQFPRFNADLPADDEKRFDDPKYPEGLGYLKIWDVLDCKLMRSLGYGPEVSVPNLVLTILGGFFTGGLGIIFVVGSFLFAFFFLSLILRAMHIFLLSTISLVILIYVSPVVITALLFDKTKSIFDSWLKQMIGFILQPVILFAYLGIFISIFDYAIIGPVEYKGDGKEVAKEIICDEKTKDSSMYCIFRISEFKTYSGFEAIGISIPFLTSMNKDKLNAIIKAALMMFVFSSFMDKVSDLAAKLVGGSTLQSRTPSAMKMAAGAYAVGEGIRKRGSRGGQKAVGAIGKKAAGYAKSAASYLGNKGKAVDTSRRAGVSGPDKVGNSKSAPETVKKTSKTPDGAKKNDDKPSGPKT